MVARGFGREMIFGLPIWAAFLLALEPGNVARAIESGAGLAWSEEIIRIAGATLLGAASTPLVLALMRRFPVERPALWRNLSVQAVAGAAIAFGLILVSCILAATFNVGDARPVLAALPDEINDNWLLLLFCLAALSAIAHAIHFRRTATTPVVAALGLDAPSQPFANTIAIKARGRVTLVDLDTVDWIETQGNYLALHAGGTVHLLRESSQRFEGKLDPSRFLRIHRRTLIALNRVAAIATLGNGDASVRLKDGTILRASRSFRDKVRSAVCLSD